MAEQPALPASLLTLLARSHPSTTSSATTSPADLNATLFPSTTYTPADTATVSDWLSKIPTLSPAELNTHLSTRTTLLGAKPSLADLAAYAVLAPQVAGWTAEQRTGEQGLHHVVRFVDFVQHAPAYGLQFSESDDAATKAAEGGEARVRIDPEEVVAPLKPRDLKAEKELKKREAAAAAAATTAAAGGENKGVKEKAKDAAETVLAAVKGEGGKKKDKKKDKEKKPQPPPPKEVSLSPAMVDLRVGHILKAEPHPAADKLYVSTVAMGDPAGTDNTSTYTPENGVETVVRTVCSGLAGLVPLAEMQGRHVVVVANLKPVTMRGVKSCAMVLAATAAGATHETEGAGSVELVSPPEGAVAGERVFFEGYRGEPEKQLNPKKKVFETLVPGFTTTEGCEVVFERGRIPELGGEGEGSAVVTADVARLRTEGGGLCTVKSLKGATVR